MATDSSIISGAIALWLCGGLTTILFLVRLGLRKWRRMPFTVGDGWIAVALIFNSVCMAGGYYVNQYGTPLATVTEGSDKSLRLTAQESSNLVLTGKLMILNRVAIVVVLWSLKMAVLHSLHHWLRKLRLERLLFYSIYSVLGLTFCASLISIFLECQPLSLYWRLFRNARLCHRNVLWIITYETSNIVTNAMLLAFPLPLVFTPGLSAWKRIQLSTIIGLGAFLIAINIIRLIEGFDYSNILPNRIVWASIEILVAALVATLPMISMLLRPAIKKPQWEQEGKRKSQRSSGVSGSTFNIAARHRDSWPRQRLESWDELSSGAWDSSASTEAEVPDSTAKIPFRDSLRNSIRISRLPPVDESPLDGMTSWLELDEVDTQITAGEPFPYGPEDSLGVAHIFVATEITREVWDVGARARIVTIPRRVKVNQSPV
ncbi:hypothetical protein F5Y19DRAFT_75297 [Xylariaceae sp. FL1651]|nr:hypothetical protein F5Y19DRAFT_75297 [Xylariaceae sp. FL1651]